MIRGYEKRELMHNLAEGKITHARLAELYGVTPDAIQKFLGRNAETIERIREEKLKGLDTRLTGMWIVEQENRIAEYQSDVDYVRESLASAEDPAKLLRIKHSALKSVAEELGALPTRTQVDHSGNLEVKYVVESSGEGV